MVVVVATDDVPDANWRKRIAEAEGKAQRMCRALVAQNAQTLGVGTAIAWLGPQAGVERSSYQSFEQAVAWIESRLGRSVPVFPGLLGRVWEEIRQAKPAVHSQLRVRS
jgi:hypothetical protein